MQYSVDDLVRLAKRDNNTIRPYLYVNPLQGKHIPTKPEDIMAMCRELAEMINVAYPDEKLYVIGLAETATGIAAAVCHFLDNVIFYQNTTREYQEEEEYLFFTESHSHATDQTLRASKIEDCIKQVDRILFIDDEVTTGSTICKLTNVIKDRYNLHDMRCSIVSILNSVPKERMDLLKEDGIDFIYLSQIPFEFNKESIMDVEYEGSRVIDISPKTEDISNELIYISHINVRNVSEFRKYDEESRRFTEFIENALRKEHYSEALVLGTEEFMYPAICLGQCLTDSNCAQEVRVHATTRSPIIVSGRKNYPLNNRFSIRSPYDISRTTFVYNLRQYDKVIVVTDAIKRDDDLSDLVQALKNVGNQNITIARWVYD